jgi:ABC-type bacteriocin/lantibiotic exporter with double-glycine peptidase domain
LSGSVTRKDLKAVGGGGKGQLKGSPLRKGLHDVTDDESMRSGSVSGSALEEGEERVTIRSLDEKVAVGGKNFSTCRMPSDPGGEADRSLGQGQRQLLALARGLLKLHNSSFLIMDESTANLDHATDQTIQNVLRTGLKDTQMLVIAHRLLTVVELDK